MLPARAYAISGVGSLEGADRWLVGLDIGRARDCSAVVVMARTWHAGDSGVPEPRYVVMHAKRFALETPYAEVEKSVANIFHDPALNRPALVVDETGVGDAITEALRRHHRCRCIGVYITGGATVSNPSIDRFNVAKETLTTTLVRLVERRRLKIHEESGEGEVLLEQLGDFSYKVNRATGNMQYEAATETVHDDLVLAAALPAWYSESQLSRTYPGSMRSNIDMEAVNYDPLRSR